ncbi:MAG: flagellar assembly protein FliW [Actinomycetota bacterium]|nr:flagellar assembly protein FliW [Actinomycetota bacterium]
MALETSPKSLAHEGHADVEPAEPVLSFVRPIIAFERSRRYAVRPLGLHYEPFASLVSLDVPGLNFVVVPPGLVFADYVYAVPERDVVELRLGEVADPSEVQTLAIVRRRDVPSPVVNLRAPIVINRKLGIASQVVLEDDCGFGFMVPVDAGSARWTAERTAERPTARAAGHRSEKGPSSCSS